MFVAVLQSDGKLHRRIAEVLDTPRECALPEAPRDNSCSRRSWTVLAWKSSERSGRKTKASKQGKLRKRGDNTHAVDSVTTLAGSPRVSTFRFGRNRCTSAEINCLQCDRRKRRTDPVCRSYGVSGKDRLIRGARTRRSDKVNELAQVLYAGWRLSCIAGSF